MKLLKLNNVLLLCNSIRDYFSIQLYKDILQFAIEDVDLSDDISAERKRIDLVHFPHMVLPLSRCNIEKGKRKLIVIAFPLQLSKTTILMLAILYNTVYNSLQCIIAYPSQDLAVLTSTVKFIPLFKKIEQFKDLIEKPFAIRSDRLKLSNAIIYWQGAGSKIVSKSAKLVLGDECSIWLTPNGVNNILELKKRTRSYNLCLQLFVSTPSYKETAFWNLFLQGSQGYYYLRCKKCNLLTMRSCDIHNLQFESTYNLLMKVYQVKPGTCRLVCPICGYLHTELDRYLMIAKGAYVHKYKDKIELRPSYQAGVLASMLNVHNWDNLADIQLASGKTASLESYVSFDNSIRGLPYQLRLYNKQDLTALSKHFFKDTELKKDDILAIYCIADTQDTFSVLGTFALTKQNNFYLMRLLRLRYLFLLDELRKIINQLNHRNGKENLITVLDRLNLLYYGDIKPLMLFGDEAGHRSLLMRNFSKIQRNILLYKGTNLKYLFWKISENNPKLFLCDAKKYQADLIFHLYNQNNKDNNYLYLTEHLTDKDILLITAFRPNNLKRDGNLYLNWECKDRIHDTFDVIKMFFAAVKISAKIYKKERFRFGLASVLNPNKVLEQLQLKKKKTVKRIAMRKPLF